MEDIIKALNKIGKNYVSESFRLDNKKNTLVYASNSIDISKAIMQKKNDIEMINVINWFNDFWIYIEIKFIPVQLKKKKIIPNIFFSLVIFKGTYDDIDKKQLFRAEWDNYTEETTKHPQPHWHFYSQDDYSGLGTTFEKYIDKQHTTFENFLKDKKDIIPISKLHFAMNGQWSEKNTDIHKISNVSDFANWFSGLLNHIKNELEYLTS